MTQLEEVATRTQKDVFDHIQSTAQLRGDLESTRLERQRLATEVTLYKKETESLQRNLHTTQSDLDAARSLGATLQEEKDKIQSTLAETRQGRVAAVPTA